MRGGIRRKNRGESREERGIRRINRGENKKAGVRNGKSFRTSALNLGGELRDWARASTQNKL